MRVPSRFRSSRLLRQGDRNVIQQAPGLLGRAAFEAGAASAGRFDLLLQAVPETLPAPGVLTTTTAGLINPADVTFRYDPQSYSYFEQRSNLILHSFSVAGASYDFRNIPSRAQTSRFAGEATGPIATYVADRPGTLTHRTAIFRRGVSGAPERSAVTTTNIVIADQASVYAGIGTMCFSSAGNFADAPAGALTTTDVATALSHLVTGGRLLIHAGETVDFGATLQVGQNGCLGRYGTATPNPRIRNTIRYSDFASGRQIVEGVDTAGTWDPITQDDPSFIGIELGGSANKIMFRCVLEGTSGGLQALSAGQGRNFTFADSRIRNFHQWGFIDDGEGLCNVVGSSIDLDFEAADNSGPIGQLFGPFRVASFDGYNVQRSYIQYDRKSSTGFSQPTGRIGTSTSSLKGNIELSITESQWVGTGIGGGQSDQTLITPGAEMRFIYVGANKFEVGADFLGAVGLPYFSQTTIENNVIFGTATRGTTNQQEIVPWETPVENSGISGTVASPENLNNTGKPYLCRNNTSKYVLFAQGTTSTVSNQALRRGQPIVPANAAFADTVIANNFEAMPGDDQTQTRDDAPQLCEIGGGLNSDGTPRPGSMAELYHLGDQAQQPVVDHNGALRTGNAFAGAFGIITGAAFPGPADFSIPGLMDVLQPNARAGAVCPLDDWSLMATNTDGTGAVTAVGDPVRWISNPWDSGNPWIAIANDRHGVAMLTDRGQQAVFFPTNAALVLTSAVGPINGRGHMLLAATMRFAQSPSLNLDANGVGLCCGQALDGTPIWNSTFNFGSRGGGVMYLGSQRHRRFNTPRIGVPRGIMTGYDDTFGTGSTSEARSDGIYEDGPVFSLLDGSTTVSDDRTARMFVGAEYGWPDLTQSFAPTEFSFFLAVQNTTFTSATVQQVRDILRARARA